PCRHSNPPSTQTQPCRARTRSIGGGGGGPPGASFHATSGEVVRVMKSRGVSIITSKISQLACARNLRSTSPGLLALHPGLAGLEPKQVPHPSRQVEVDQ